MKFQRLDVLGQKHNKLLIQSDALSRKGRRYVTCLCDCGKTIEMRLESVRTGHATSCGCAWKKVPKTTCSVCSKEFPAYTDRATCSNACRMVATRIERVCRQCEKKFTVLRSAISGKTNASGNFCSMDCRNVWMCHTEKITGRGSRWRSIREASLKTMPCCALCAKRAPLEVHHIVPYRLTYDNSDSNLIVLCKTHHYFVECITRDILKVDSDYERVQLVLANILRSREFVTRSSVVTAFTERQHIAVA